MAFGVGVEYALHCLVNLIDPPAGRHLGVAELAEYQGISPSYLSKIFVRLKKAGVVRSAPGVKGGYELAKPADQITFLEVVEAVEGPVQLFQCRSIIDGCILDAGKPKQPNSTVCAIHAVMMEAEEKVRGHLRTRTLGDIDRELDGVLSVERRDATRRWFENALKLSEA
ncbi:RrF2 family transcriptional regulator [Capsulimonas corticalis]|uniref:RrF2 family transcriptional regulator n=1 Tax=Capsulimonas corticalis TaxID=2219043 RepID=UPI000E65BC84